jgi:hypothetical protein
MEANGVIAAAIKRVARRFRDIPVAASLQKVTARDDWPNPRDSRTVEPLSWIGT